MLINGILFDSEAWHGVNLKQIKTLEAIYEDLLISILKLHRKTPTDFLYLPLRWIIAQRRILYLKHIMKRHENDLLRRVFQAQKYDETKGDFVDLVTKDRISLEITHEEVTSNTMSKTKLRNILKTSAQKSCFIISSK